VLYFDTSAVVSLFIEDEHTAPLLKYLRNIAILSGMSSIITPLEYYSALQRRLSSKEITESQVDQARGDFVEFRKKIRLIPLDENALKVATHLQRIYSLRPGDSIQLGAALMCRDNPSKVTFLSFDEKLNLAAQREGFNLLEAKRTS
jgi:predicted nucleic acid-binding protein